MSRDQSNEKSRDDATTPNRGGDQAQVRNSSFSLAIIRRAAWVSALLLLAVTSAFVGWRASIVVQKPRPESTGEALVKSAFDLVDHRGNRVTERDFHGRWQLVFFGFTHCPDVCPTTLLTVAEVLQELGPEGSKLAPLFITVDPQRDTPGVLRDYVSFFHTDLIGLTGTPEQIEAAAQSFRAYYVRTESKGSPENYMIDHTVYLYLMKTDGAYEAVYSLSQFSAKQIAADILARFGGRAEGDRK